MEPPAQLQLVAWRWWEGGPGMELHGWGTEGGCFLVGSVVVLWGLGQGGAGVQVKGQDLAEYSRKQYLVVP